MNASGIQTCLPWDVLGHDGIEAVEKVSAGKGKGEEGEEELWPATLQGVAHVAGLAVECDHLFHVQCCLLPYSLLQGKFRCGMEVQHKVGIFT